MKFRTGPAAYDRNYNLLFFLLGLGLGAYFYYDYEIGYISKNRAEAIKQLTAQLEGTGATLPEDGVLGPQPTQDDFSEVARAEPPELEVVQEALGTEPLFSKSAEVAGRDGAITWFVSDYGAARIAHVGDVVIWPASDWIKWNKTKAEIDQQWYFMWICAAFAALFGWRTYRAATLTLEVNDEGMRYGGKWVPKDAMRRLTDYSEKGLCNLFYELGGSERRIRLDNQKIRDFEGAIDALIALKGFPDPRPVEEEDDEDYEPHPEDQHEPAEEDRPPS